MNILPIVKTISSIAVSVGAGSIVGGALKHVAAPSPQATRVPIMIGKIATGIGKIATGIGAVALSGVLAEISANYTERTIDQTVKAFSDIKIEVKNQVEEKVVEKADEIKKDQS